MKDITPQASKLMDIYNAVTGYNLPLTMQRIFSWDAWMAKGYTGDDLCLVIRHIQFGIRKGTRQEGGLRFSNLIQDTERFGEELGMARAETRQRKHTTPRERVLAQARPCVCEHKPDEPCTARPVSHWIEELRKAAG